MVVATDINLQGLRTEAFKGFVQFLSGSTWYRLKERQNLRVTFNFLREGHYTDDGVKVNTSAGISHSFVLTLKITSDMFTTSFGSGYSGQQIVSEWVYQNTKNTPQSITFVTTLTALAGPSGASTEKYIHLKFVLDPSTFGPITFNPNGGTNEITISGEVLSITSLIRSATKDQ